MILADTNCWIAYLGTARGRDVGILDKALEDRTTAMIPPVLTELLSEPRLTAEIESSLLEIPLLDAQEGFWWRAGKLRAMLLGKRHKPKLADTMIAQFCLDYGASLLTRDRDFRPFVKHAGLVLL